MYLGLDLEALMRLLEESQSIKLERKYIFISLDEFERLVTNHLFFEPSKIVVKPVLQVWGKLADDRNKLSGFLVVTGLLKSNLVIVGYSAETLDEIGIDINYEKQKFSELIDVAFVDILISNGVAQNITILDIIVEK